MASNQGTNIPENVEAEDLEDYVVNEDDEDGVDNEDTIAEDELHELEEDNDLAALQEEAEMDIEELRRKYYPEAFVIEARENLGNSSATTANNESNPDNNLELEDAETSDNYNLLAFMNTENGEIIGYDSDDDVDFTYDSHKSPRVGPQYQEMNIPAVQSEYKSCHDADLLWRPSSKVNDDQINDYQASVIDLSIDMVCNKLPSAPGVEHQVRPDSSQHPLWDSEEALYVLMENGYDVAKAKAAFLEGPPDVNLPRKTHFGIYLPWSEEDVRNFEMGMHICGKEFPKIRSEYVPGRSIGEIIHFYYRYKKSEKWDMFVREHTERYGGSRSSEHSDPMEEMMNAIQRSEIYGEQAAAIIAESEEYTADETAPQN